MAERKAWSTEEKVQFLNQSVKEAILRSLANRGFTRKVVSEAFVEVKEKGFPPELVIPIFIEMLEGAKEKFSDLQYWGL